MQVLDKGLAMLGAPETVENKVIELQEMGVNHVMFLQNFGGLDPERVRDSMRRIATEVIPRVKSA